MVKVYCDRCGKEVKSKDLRKVELTVRPYITIGGRFDLDYCEECFKDLLGNVRYDELMQKESERKKRVEERKKRA